MKYVVAVFFLERVCEADGLEGPSSLSIIVGPFNSKEDAERWTENRDYARFSIEPVQDGADPSRWA